MIVKRISLLDIVSLIKKGLNLTQISKQLNISKQRLNYHISLAKEKGLIKKKGYGVWEIDPIEEVKIRESSSKATNLKSLEEIKVKSGNYTFLRKTLTRMNKLKCIFCNSEIINFHHIKQRKDGGNNDLTNIIPICPNHHLFIHQEGYNEKMLKQIEEYKEDLKKFIMDYPEQVVRGHAFIWKVQARNLKGIDWKKLLNERKVPYETKGLAKYPRIIINGKKVILGQKNIVIYEPISFFAQNSVVSRKYAIWSLLEALQSLEKTLGVSIKGFRFTPNREHYSLVKNELANQCNKNNEKINVFNEKGLWLSIDNSFNLDELETLGVMENKPMETNLQVQKWYNNMKETNFKVTPEFILNCFAQSQSQLLEYSKQNKMHLSLIQEYRKENISWRKHKEKEIRQEITSGQRKIGEFL